jgi:Tfp pilus assembly protein PilV
MAILNRKIQASTLVEVIVALIIILISFLLAVMVIDENAKQSNSRTLMKAEQCILQLHDKTIQEKRYIDESPVFDNIHLKKTVSDYPGTSELKILEIQAFDANNKLLLSQREIIIPE